MEAPLRLTPDRLALLRLAAEKPVEINNRHQARVANALDEGGLGKARPDSRYNSGRCFEINDAGRAALAAASLSAPTASPTPPPAPEERHRHTETERRIRRALSSMPYGALESVHSKAGRVGLDGAGSPTSITLESIADYFEALMAGVRRFADDAQAEREELHALRADVAAVRRLLGLEEARGIADERLQEPRST